VFYIVIPILDLAVGVDPVNPPESVVPALSRERYYRYAVYVAVPMVYATFLGGTWLVATHSLHWYEWLGVLVTVGGSGGNAINLGHELGHSTDPFERWLAKIVLAPVGYGHFYTEHNRGHHVRVATPEDPASARMGETFWKFLPRCQIGSIQSAWRIERERLARLGLGPWSLKNENLRAWGLSVILFTLTALWLGWRAVPFMLIQAWYGGSLLEVVNYLEHYGLLRQKQADGRYERCQPTHSWNSNHTISNLMLYNLERHSDHHANPTRPYQALRHFEEAPQLPCGYTGMILVAYVPWLWFRLMDKKVVAHYGGDLRRANLDPAQRERLLAKYPPPTA
jgi:alkane 1-monooxygenase